MFITTLQIVGYQITEQIHASSHTLIYRAIRETDTQAVVIKILYREYPSFSELVQFRNQYTITHNLNISGIIKSYSLEAYQNSYALVMEDFGGISLEKFIQHQPMTVKQFLRIAIQIADTLHELHTNRVIHKDIKPANILINPSTEQIKLTDFSIASLLQRETQDIQNPNVLFGTLAYMSPEQTGRMNRGIDYRSDFYSLGVTFYQLLTGKLPFNLEEAMELIHCHIAKQPPQIRELNPEIPPILSDIVLKLMAKNAEDRYQSALGLHYDLVTCLEQLESTGTITNLAIAQYDISTQFLIPEKLYGREQEVEMLWASFWRVSQGNAELMLIVGFSGIGKTAVVNEVQKPIVEKHGYFIKGKFDQLQRNIPLSAFVQAFRNLIKQLLCEPADQVRQWRTKILQVVGETGQVIIEVIPELEQLIGKQPPILELSGNDTQNRFNLLFPKFVQLFTSESHPLVIFLDDLQWADSASLRLLQLLMYDAKHLLILGAYRNNEVSLVHPLILTVDEIRKLGTTVNTITLQPLTSKHINQLVADTLNCPQTTVLPLVQLIYQKTKGNPFFTRQFLKSLHEDGFIQFNRNRGYWECDISQIKFQSLTEDIIEFMAQQLQKLPIETQNVLKLAACIGAQFDLSTLAIVAQQSEVEIGTALWKALQLGLIIPLNQTYKFFQADPQAIESTATNSQIIDTPYRFLHDRVQQAAYYLIPEEQKANMHYQVGRLLLNQISPTTREENIFTIVNQLNYGIDLIPDERERDGLAQLNLLAGRKARASVAYQAARDYAKTGLNLLRESGWQRNYKICLELHNLAAEVLFLCGEFAEMNHLFQTVINHTKIPLDKVEVYTVRMQSLAAQKQISSVIPVGKCILQELGVDLPEDPTPEQGKQALWEISTLIGERTIEDLFYLPKMVNAEKIAIMQVASTMTPACFISSSHLYPIIVALQVKLSIQYGNSPVSAYSYACYAFLLNNFIQDFTAAAQFCQLAYHLASTPAAKNIRSMAFSMIGLFLLHRTAHLRETLPIFQIAYQVGLEMGKLDYVGFSISFLCMSAYWCGQALAELEPQIAAYHQQLLDLHLLMGANRVAVFWETTVFLLGNPDKIEFSSEQALYEEKSNDRTCIFYFYLYRAMLMFLMADINQAVANIKQTRNYLASAKGMIVEAGLYLYESLIFLSMLSDDRSELSAYLEQVDENQAKLQIWAKHAPMNYLHKWQLVAAQKAAILGQKAEAIDLYDQAIAGAKVHGYIQEEALANELASKFYLGWGKENIAASYMQAAYYCYSRWGAKAKIIHLEKLYPQLLSPILQSTPRQSLNSPDSLNTISSSTNATNQLDLTTIIKASQTLSEKINLDNLLQKLMEIVIENAGANMGELILNRAGSLDLEDKYLPTSIIRYVENTREYVVINHAACEGLFVTDPYIIKNQVKSVLCTPIIHQGKLLAILYLENSLTVGAFTTERLQVLQLLCSQAAISLENAQLYADLEEKVSIRTQELESTLYELKLTQTQLIQTEKMSSLGQMVGSIAHEINNPISFIHGNIDHVKRYIDDLISLVNFYQKVYPNITAETKDFLEEIDFDYLKEDVPKVMSSIKSGTQRIREIILTLRNFSRLDEVGLKLVDVHEGIDSTLLILQSRLQAESDDPAIKILKNYTDLPKVECYAAELNQVFMNILINAIEALNKSDFSKTQIEGVISISTQLLNSNTVTISIRDNGQGITPDIKQKIFDPFFTTKPIGKGIGLGLSISYQIVEKHNGKIECFSTPGIGTEFLIQLPLQQKTRVGVY